MPSARIIFEDLDIVVVDMESHTGHFPTQVALPDYTWNKFAASLPPAFHHTKLAPLR